MFKDLRELVQLDPAEELLTRGEGRFPAWGRAPPPVRDSPHAYTTMRRMDGSSTTLPGRNFIRDTRHISHTIPPGRFDQEKFFSQLRPH